MNGSAATEAFDVCEAIAEDRTRATRMDPFADGYRTAARDIVTEIRARRRGRPLTELGRDLRDAEVEARTLARVVAVAAAFVDSLHPSDSNMHPADAVRGVLHVFFTDDDLPSNLRRRVPSESTTRLVVERETGTDGALRRPDAGERIGARPRKARRRAD